MKLIKEPPDIDTIKKIAEYFHVSIEYLMGLADVQYNPREEEFKEMVHIYYSLSKDEKRELIKELKQEYAVLVSEILLQQTNVEKVINPYNTIVKNINPFWNLLMQT